MKCAFENGQVSYYLSKTCHEGKMIMRKFDLLYLVAVIFTGLSSISVADVFVSGRIDANVTAPVGTITLPGAREIRLADGGVPNFVNAISGAFPQVGDELRTIGIVPIPGGNVSGINSDFDGSQRFVGVFAGRGTFTAADSITGNVTGSYDPAPDPVQNPNGTNSLTFQIFDRTGLLGVDGNNPFGAAGDQVNPPGPNQGVNDWVTAIGAPVAVLDLVTRPEDARTGAPGPPATQQHGLFNALQNINTFATTLDAAAILDLEEDFKFEITDFGTFLANLDVQLDLTDPVQAGLDPTPTDASTLASLRLATDPSASAGGVFQTPDVADLNTIFNALVGIDFADQSGAGAPGEDYVLLDGALYASNGDNANRVDGGFATPGAQFQQTTTTPEPGAMLIWTMVAGIGAAFGVRVRRRES